MGQGISRLIFSQQDKHQTLRCPVVKIREATDQTVCGSENILSFSQVLKNRLDLCANHIQLTFVYDKKTILSSSRPICQILQQASFKKVPSYTQSKFNTLFIPLSFLKNHHRTQKCFRQILQLTEFTLENQLQKHEIRFVLIRI